MQNVVEYYYMWKTTDRYVQQKRLKAVDAESKLKQVYIPSYTKPNSAMMNNISPSITATTKGGVSILNGSSNGNLNNDVVAYNSGKPCESCNSTQATQVFINTFEKVIYFFVLKNNFFFLFSILVVFMGSNKCKQSLM